MKRVLKFTSSGEDRMNCAAGDYCNNEYMDNPHSYDSAWVCGDATRELFDVNGSFDLHVNDKKPRGDNFYTVESGAFDWCDSLWPDSTDRPSLDGSISNWALWHFPQVKTLYVWVMA